jgi:hypothetical protein
VPIDQNNESVILYDSSGVEMNVQNGVAIPASTRGLLAMGSDSGGVARQLRTDTSGILQVTPTSSTADPATFTVLASATAIALNKSMVSIVNTSAAVTARIYRIFIINTQTTLITGVIANFELRRITGHSAGTSITPLSMDTTDSLNAGITAITGSTVAGESASLIMRYQWSSDEWGGGAPDVESGDHALQLLNPAFDQVPGTKPLFLRQNQGITLKQTTNSTAGTFDIYVLFTQV